MGTDGQQIFTSDREHAHEGTDLNVRAVLAFAAALVFFGVLVHILLWGFYRILDNYHATHQNPAKVMIPRAPKDFGNRSGAAEGETPEATNQRIVASFPTPRLQVDDVRDMNQLRAAEDKMLNHYVWIDKNQGKVRIPIERAMEILAQRGLPHVPAQGAATGQAAGNPAQTRPTPKP